MRKRGVRKSFCSKCNGPIEETRLGKQSYCLSCHNEYMRANRKPYAALSPEEKQKAVCRSTLKMAIRRGKVKRGACEVCGKPNGEAHHSDYSQPYLVKWLCRACHIAHHKGNIKETSE